MALEVIGSGLGRTGTKSMQTALNMLGFGPCHHMVEVIANPQTMPAWTAASKGDADWDRLFDGYRSMVDYPGAVYWRELAAYYPNAKVLHTVRDPDQWFDSTQATIFARANMDKHATPGPAEEFFASFMGDFRDHIDDRAFMTGYFRRHNEAVQAAIPAERLLVYEVGSGWAPLCAFLGVDVPKDPYPSENSRAEFAARHLPAS